MRGRVVSNKQMKTAIVLVEGIKRDPLYKKSFKFSKRYSVDDPNGSKIGDLVELIKIRPISKRKHWRITKVVGRDMEEVISQELQEAAKETISQVLPEEKESASIETTADKGEKK